MLRKLRNEEFDCFFSIIEKSFPSDEHRTYESHRSLLSNEKYSIYALPNESDKPMAVISVWCFDSFAFIEHFAVAPDFRNLGLGTRVLAELKEHIKIPLCLEAELPETDIAKRRIAFYERNGFFANGYPYIQPPYSNDKNPVPLTIMTSEGTTRKCDFEKIKATLYKEVYNR